MAQAMDITAACIVKIHGFTDMVVAATDTAAAVLGQRVGTWF